MNAPAQLVLKPTKGVATFRVSFQPLQADGTPYAAPTVNVYLAEPGFTLFAGLSPEQARAAAAQLITCAAAAEAP